MKIFITYSLLLFSVIFCFGQKEELLVKGIITNYANQPVLFYKCYGDTLLLADSAHTGKNGEFAFSSNDNTFQRTKLITNHLIGMYKIALQRNQSFYVLNDGQPVEIKTVYQPNSFYNIATDTLVVLKSDNNKKFYEFQHLQYQINIANYWLMQMMRLYPLTDPFHKQIVDEYFKRYKTMEQFVKKLLPHSTFSIQHSKFKMATKVSLAYYLPVNPDWKQPDPWRDSIIALHYFDYFSPADSLYMNSNILQEKMDIYLKLNNNKRDAYGQPLKDEKFSMQAADNFLDKTKTNQSNFEFCLQYLLKKFKKESMELSFLNLCDLYLKPKKGDCETENTQFDWARDIATKLRKVSVGSIAPDFEVKDNLKLSALQSDYTLVLFWASWCEHCIREMPDIKQVIDGFNAKAEEKLLTVTVSVDTDKKQWQKFIEEKNLSSLINFSDLKGWNSEVALKYNVHATPAMFLLDKDKKIIDKPKTVEQLIIALDKLH